MDWLDTRKLVRTDELAMGWDGWERLDRWRKGRLEGRGEEKGGRYSEIVLIFCQLIGERDSSGVF